MDWAPFHSQAGKACLFSDFDGTLSPIVEERESAEPLPGVAEALTRLSERFAVVAVVSGRPVQFLSAVLPPVPGLVLAGVYGMERSVGGDMTVSPEAAPWKELMAELVALAHAQAPPGLEVEDKGLSFVLHSRKARSTFDWAQRWASEQARAHGLVAQPGRCAVELLPPVQTGKGAVVTELAVGDGPVCFLGDDTGDLSAFAVLKAMRAQGRAVARVGVGSEEAPPELPSAVDVMVNGPGEALKLLRYLAGLDGETGTR